MKQFDDDGRFKPSDGENFDREVFDRKNRERERCSMDGFIFNEAKGTIGEAQHEQARAEIKKLKKELKEAKETSQVWFERYNEAHRLSGQEADDHRLVAFVQGLMTEVEQEKKKNENLKLEHDLLKSVSAVYRKPERVRINELVAEVKRLQAIFRKIDDMEMAGLMIADNVQDYCREALDECTVDLSETSEIKEEVDDSEE